jgi:hypothetical protein
LIEMNIQVGHISSCSSKHDHLELPACDESAGC